MSNETTTPVVETQPWRNLWGIYLFYAILFTLGSDYVITVSTGPVYYTRISSDTPYDYNGFSSEKGQTDFSTSQTLWACGQLIGSSLATRLPYWIGNRFSCIMLIILAMSGNLMYMAADPSLANSVSLAQSGKFVAGLGSGLIGLGMGYIPAFAATPKDGSHSLMIARVLLSFGMTFGTGMTIAFARINKQWESMDVNPGNFSAFFQAALYSVTLISAIFCLDERAPPKKSSTTSFFESGVWTSQTFSWLGMIFVYGFAWSALIYFGPVFLGENQYHQEEISTIIFAQQFSGFIASVITTLLSFHFGKDLEPFVFLSPCALLVAIALGMMYGGQLLFDKDKDGSSEMFITGLLLFAAASTVYSTMAMPCYKNILPKSAFGTMMPLYKVMLDLGKIPAPVWSDFALGISTSLAYIPLLFMFTWVTFMTSFCKNILTEKAEYPKEKPHHEAIPVEDPSLSYSAPDNEQMQDIEDKPRPESEPLKNNGKAITRI